MKANYSYPAAQLVLPANAPRAQWLTARQGALGGSDASAVLEVSKYVTRHMLWLDKTGRAAPRAMTEAMYWGSALEPALRKRFVEDTELPVRSCGLLRSKEHPWMQVSVDGLVADGGLFESKTANSWAAGDDWEDDEIPDHAAVQVQHGLAVTGRSHAWVVGLIGGQDWRIRRVERDEALIELLIEQEREFWETYIVPDVEPPLTARDLDDVKDRYREVTAGPPVELPELGPLLKRREAFRAIAAGAEADAQAIEAQIRTMIGSAEAAAVGDDLVTLRANGTFSSKRFAADEPVLAAELQRLVPKLDTDKLKADYPELYGKYRARVLRVSTPKKK